MICELGTSGPGIRNRSFCEIAKDRRDAFLASLNPDKGDEVLRLINRRRVSNCGNYTEGGYYTVEADLPGNRILISDDHGTKMIESRDAFSELNYEDRGNGNGKK